jgi:hypothetical protein
MDEPGWVTLGIAKPVKCPLKGMPRKANEQTSQDPVSQQTKMMPIGTQSSRLEGQKTHGSKKKKEVPKHRVRKGRRSYQVDWTTTSGLRGQS